MNYQDFINSKSVKKVNQGIPHKALNAALFDYQQHIVSKALQRGKCAIFADTGLGKTLMELEWAKHISEYCQKPVLILAPLSVTHQMEREAAKFGYSANVAKSQPDVNGLIAIANYEKLHHFDASQFCGIVLDESSILKSHDGTHRQMLTEFASTLDYRLSASATPSPNDYMELGTQSEFLNILTRSEMLATFFTHDGGDTAKWRLKGHGRKEFWKWMATWAIAIRKPSDLGFSDENYELPPLNIHDVTVSVSNENLSTLFAMQAQTLQERRQAKKDSIEDRIKACADLVNNSSKSWIIWCNLNSESEALKKAINDSFEVKGSDSNDRKESIADGFINGDVRILISKPSIFGFGLNWQHCHNMAFVGLSDSYEQLYQAIRRCWRFGQTKPVNVYMIAAETEGNIKQNLERKELQMTTMFKEMTDSMKEFGDDSQTDLISLDYKNGIASGRNWELHLGDCVQEIQKLDDNSVDYSIFSPPFANLYTFSSSACDMSNVKDTTEFYAQFNFLVKELHRVIKSGRLLSFHCCNLTYTKNSHGFRGVHDFRGEMIRLFQDAGFVFHSEVCIWKDPVAAMYRTKDQGLLWGQAKRDASLMRQGLPDYLVTMRKLGDNEQPIRHDETELTREMWQNYASPVWMDINAGDTLQYRSARENDDERHISLLQLEVIRRALTLWTNPNDLVLSPFAGIGSEGYEALKMDRRFVGFELKESYFNCAVKNLKSVEMAPQQQSLFDAP